MSNDISASYFLPFLFLFVFISKEKKKKKNKERLSQGYINYHLLY